MTIVILRNVVTKDLFFREYSQDRFNGSDLISKFYFYFGFQRDKHVNSGAEFYYSALVSPVFYFTGL